MGYLVGLGRARRIADRVAKRPLEHFLIAAAAACQLAAPNNRVYDARREADARYHLTEKKHGANMPEPRRLDESRWYGETAGTFRPVFRATKKRRGIPGWCGLPE